MKTRLTTLAVLATALGGFVGPLAAATPDQITARMYRVDQVLLGGHPTIKIGASINLVRQAIGAADEEITPDLWLYHNFKPVRGAVGGDPCCELVIGFTDNRVSSLHLANPSARDVFCARVSSGVVASAGVLAAIPEPAAETQVATR